MQFIKWNGEAFAKQVLEHPAKLNVVLRDILHLVGFTAYEAIVVGNAFGNATGTPVRIGWARANWYVELATMTISAAAVDDAARQQGGDPSGGKSLVRAALIGQAQLGMMIYFVNGATYAVMLEYGWSDQAPAGMVRLVTRSGQLILNHAVRAIAV